jgi:hypothetical protein
VGVACQDEMHSFEHMGMYEIVSQPKDKNVVSSKWGSILNADLMAPSKNTRLELQGFTQTEAIDYDETFAPITNL